ncbi:MAG: Ig-like domain repeat protein [Acidobacteriaceae bacterium]|nr:Ig-like domain repeat protein [Acidobacteriaceae bacterium]
MGLSLIFALWCGGILSQSIAQSAPYPLPYLINTVAGGSAICSTAADAMGDGCPALQASFSTNLTGIAVDARGNLYVEDSNNNLLRRVDAKTGIITVAAGTTSTGVCAATLDKYGDGCPASDGLANASGGYTALGKPFAIAIAANGDIYMTGTASIVQKVSAATGLMSVVAGTTSPAGKSGSAVAGYTGDGGPATSATVNAPRGVAVDAAYDVFIADYVNNVVRVVYNGGAAAAAQITAANPSVTNPVIGYIYTIAGSQSKTAGTTGDGGPAGAALLTNPSDVAIDSYGNVFIVDQSSVVRMIYAGGGVMGISSPVVGNIYTVAGGGSVKGNTLKAILGTTATMSVVRRIVLDRKGNLFISDSKQIIWFEDSTTGWMRPIAGVYAGSSLTTGCAQETDSIGNNCPATVATIALGNEGYGLAVDANENLYISDASAETIRKVSSDLIFSSTTAGAPKTQTVELHYAVGDTPSSSNPLVFSDSDYSAATPSCTKNGDGTTDCTVAVSFTPSMAGTDRATLTATDSAGNVRSIGFEGTGSAAAFAIDPGTASVLSGSLSQPSGVAKDNAGNLFIADTANDRVMKYSISSATMTVLAGTGVAGYSGDGQSATTATLSSPRAVTVASDGAVYIADTGNNVVRRVDPVTGTISTVAGGASTICSAAANMVGDGCPGTQSIFSSPAGLVVDSNGLLYVADTGNNRVRAVPLNGSGVVTVAGGGKACTSATDLIGDGCNALQAVLSGPTQIRFDLSGNLLIADTGNHEIRRVNLTASGQAIVSLAGNGQAGGGGDGGLAISAELSSPVGLALDASGSIYVGDTGNQAVRMIDSVTGVISTIAGFNGASGTGIVPGLATAVALDLPQQIELDSAGTLYIADTGNSRVLAVNRDSVSMDFGKVNLGQSSAMQAYMITSSGTLTGTLGSPLTTSSGSTSTFSFVPATTSGCSASQQLASGVQCAMAGQFTPTQNGNQSAIYTFTGSTGINAPVPSVTLKGGGVTLVSTSVAAAITTPASGTPQYGSTTVLTVTVTPASQGTTSISGTVTLQIDGVSQAAVVLSASGSNGVASVTLPLLKVGPHTIGVTYSGDDVYGGSTSSTLTLAVAQAATNVLVSASPTSAVQFQSVIFTAKVSTSSSAVPTGTVTFLNGATTLSTATLTAQGIATFTSATLDVGTYSIVAQYSGDGNFAASTSTPALTFVVGADPQGFTLAAASSVVSVAQGGAVQTTVALTPTNTLNGVVTMSCSGLPANSYCTFQPQTMSFTPATDQATSVTVTLWTNVSPGTVPTQASNVRFAGGVWYALAAPLLTLAFRRRRRICSQAFLMLSAAALLSFAGCSTNTPISAVTPAGTSSVVIKGSGPNGLQSSVSIAFTVVQK